MKTLIKKYFTRKEFANSPEARKKYRNIYGRIVKRTLLLVFFSIFMVTAFINAINIFHVELQNQYGMSLMMDLALQRSQADHLKGLQEYTEEQWKKLLSDDGQKTGRNRITNRDDYLIVYFDPHSKSYEVDRAAGGNFDVSKIVSKARSYWEQGKDHGYDENYSYYGQKAEESGYVIYIFHDIIEQKESSMKTVIRSFLMSLFCFVLIAGFSLLVLNAEISRVAEINYRQQMFVADAGHELKTPLSIINGDLEILEMEHGEDEWTRSIHHQIHRLYDLTEALMLQSKCEAEMGQELTPVNMKRVIEEALDEFLPLAKLNRQEFRLNLPEKIILNGDVEMFRKLFSLLIDNAIRYASKESVIEIEMRETPKTVTVVMTNEAEGLEKKDYDVLFQRFYRMDPSRSSDNAGYGMGLAIARTITETYNGTISAESPDGKHMVFQLCFEVDSKSRRMRKKLI